MVAPEGIVTNLIIKIFNLNEVPVLLGESRYALNTVIAYNIWTGFGVNIILFGGAMARIPEDIIEYSKLEGVGFYREIVQIILPLIWPTISTVLTLSVVGIFNSSGPILFLSPGREDTYTIAYWIFKQVYEPNGALNYAAAVGIFFTIIGLPIVLFIKWLLGKIGSDIEY
jgi:ABC-type sugar transport system permease subunit